MADYRQRRDLAVRSFAGLPWIAMRAPDSGPYLWGDVRALTDQAVAFSEQLLEQERVAVMPGDALGVPGHIRLGYISDDVATLEEGIRRIVAFGERTARAGAR
jgi:aspartate aminotransferase